MSQPTIRRTARFIAAGAAAVSVLLGAGIGPAQAGPMPQTREHVLLARQVGVPWPTATAYVDCYDWTNDDGTVGTDCPPLGFPFGLTVEV